MGGDEAKNFIDKSVCNDLENIILSVKLTTNATHAILKHGDSMKWI